MTESYPSYQESEKSQDERTWSIDVNTEMNPMLWLFDKDFEVAIIKMLQAMISSLERSLKTKKQKTEKLSKEPSGNQSEI